MLRVEAAARENLHRGHGFHIPLYDPEGWTRKIPMEETLRIQIETYLSHLNGLIGRGRQLRGQLAGDTSSESAIRETRVWQEECGGTINQLSGGSKAHWLARAFSGAFLMRAVNGNAAECAPPAEIVSRLLGVLEQAVGSIAQMENSPAATPAEATPTPHRFDFVHNPELRPILEQAYRDGRHALEQGEYELSLNTSTGVLEAIVTDALEHKGLSALAGHGAPTEKIADWPFETRITVAERAGLIRGGCARLPAVARSYREQNENGPKTTISERDARLAGQVLHVVMRDLDPGR